MWGQDRCWQWVGRRPSVSIRTVFSTALPPLLDFYVIDHVVADVIRRWRQKVRLRLCTNDSVASKCGSNCSDQNVAVCSVTLAGSALRIPAQSWSLELSFMSFIQCWRDAWFWQIYYAPAPEFIWDLHRRRPVYVFVVFGKKKLIENRIETSDGIWLTEMKEKWPLEGHCTCTRIRFSEAISFRLGAVIPGLDSDPDLSLHQNVSIPGQRNLKLPAIFNTFSYEWANLFF